MAALYSDFAFADDMMIRREHQQSYPNVPQQEDEGFVKRHKGKLAVGALALGALGTAGYIYREELQRFFKFGQYANDAVEDSADVVIAKLNLALNLFNHQDVQLEDVKTLIIQAKQEAQRLVNVNKRLQEQLAKVAKAQPEA
jgi:uncharacterized protein HemX